MIRMLWSEPRMDSQDFYRQIDIDPPTHRPNRWHVLILDSSLTGRQWDKQHHIEALMTYAEHEAVSLHLPKNWEAAT